MVLKLHIEDGRTKVPHQKCKKAVATSATGELPVKVCADQTLLATSAYLLFKVDTAMGPLMQPEGICQSKHNYLR